MPSGDRTTDEWNLEVQARVAALNARGVVFQGVELRYLINLCERLLSPSVLDTVRREHLAWFEPVVADAERQAREAMFTQGVPGTMGNPPGSNGSNGGPNRAQRRHG